MLRRYQSWDFIESNAFSCRALIPSGTAFCCSLDGELPRASLVECLATRRCEKPEALADEFGEAVAKKRGGKLVAVRKHSRAARCGK